MDKVKLSPIVSLNGEYLPASKAASFEGAGRGYGGELATWVPSNGMADSHILPNKNLADARAGDVIRNHGMAAGGIQSSIDNIVGDHFKLSAKPRYRLLGIKPEQSAEFAREAEALFQSWSEDERCFVDAERKRNFTMLIRAGIENHKRSGEIMAAAEWINSPGTPFKTAVKLINGSRVCNPQGKADSNKLRAGVEINKHGAALAYWVKSAEVDPYFGGLNINGKWKRIPRELPWGRQQFIHVFEPFEDGQTRALSSFVSVLSRLKMLDKYQSTKLQNAIVGATYAAAIESELDAKAAFELIGEGEKGTDKLAQWLGVVDQYHDGADVRFNGVKIPHLVPGEKLHINSPGNADHGYSDYEASLLRYVAAGLNISYEQLSKDYSKVSYSSARASLLESWRYNRGQKKVIADRLANQIYSLWLEEAISKKLLKLPNNLPLAHFFKHKSSWCRASWIGAGKMQIDGLKEVKESVLRIQSGLSTYENECANNGIDYLEMFDQQEREIDERKDRGLPEAIYAQTQELAPDSQDLPEDNNHAPTQPTSNTGTS